MATEPFFQSEIPFNARKQDDRVKFLSLNQDS